MMDGNKGKIIVALVAVVVLSAIVAAVLMGEGNANQGDKETIVSNQIEAAIMLGDIGWEGLTAVTLDDSDNVYVLGWAGEATNITTEDAFDRICGGNDELILAKYTPDLSSLLTCTYLGGEGKERGYEIDIAPNGDVYVAGGTTSQDFPVTVGAFNTSGPVGLGGNVWTNFICRISPDLSEIAACTYVGGKAQNPNCHIDFVPSGEVVVGGTLDGEGIPATEGAYSEEQAGDTDIYVTILSSDLTSASFSTFIGGSDSDWLNDLVADPQGSIYLVGGTKIDDNDPWSYFPTTVGAYQTDVATPGFGGHIEGFVARLSVDLAELEASTFMGTDDADQVLGAALDPEGNLVVCGETHGALTTTEGAYERTKRAVIQGFVAKLNPDLNDVLACTYVGTATTYITSIACDADGQIYIHGLTGGFPTTAGAIRETYGGYNNDMFLAQFDPELSFLRSSTYLGGNYDEGEGYGLTVLPDGTVFVVGFTTSTNFPEEGMGHTAADSADGFVVKIGFGEQ